ncbi:hypothetical protein ACVMHR_006270 [Bradyrhizobium diazoefficiens]
MEALVWNSRSSSAIAKARCGKRDDDAGDHQGLRHRIIADPRRRTAPSNDAEQEEYAAAEQIEGDDLAEGLGLRDQAVAPGIRAE